MKNIKLTVVAKFLFSFLLVGFLITRIDRHSISELSTDILFIFAISIFVTLLSITIMALRWSLLINSFLGFSLSFRFAIRYYLTGMFFNIFLPGAIGGDIIRTQRLSAKHDTPLTKAIMITVFERLAGIYGLFILLAFSLSLRNFPHDFLIEGCLPAWLLTVSPILILACMPLIKWLLQKRKVEAGNLYILKITFVSLVAQTGDIIIAWIFSLYFGLGIPLSAFFFIMPLVYMATVLPISLGGLGVREGAFAGLMILYGAEPSVAIVISFCMYLVKVLVGVSGYFIYISEK